MGTIELRVSITLGDDTAKILAQVLGPALQHAMSGHSQEVNGSRGTARRPVHNPLFAGQQPPDDQGDLIDTNEVAKLLKVSHRHVTRLAESGGMPPPLRIGRAVRWSLDVIKKWIADGCPKSGG